MNTTGLVMTVTDELLAELEQQSVRDPGGAFPVRYAVISELTAELRRLRAENAELAKDAGRLDYMIGEQAIVYEQNGTASPTVYSLSWPVERCTQTEWHKSARDAIDTAMQAAK